MTARRKKTKKKGSWGGARPGAGRPKGSGTGPGPNSRCNRVAVMLSNKDLMRVVKLAQRRDLPLATLAHKLLLKGLRASR